MVQNNGYCQVVGLTDIGCVRKANEDFLGWSETKNGLVAVVCDGMGGHAGGATASHIAVESILDTLQTQFYEDPRIAIGEAIDIANNAILRQAQITPELMGMGSTCVMLIVRNGLVYIGYVGDSRVYLIRNKIIRQLTKDHSYVQMLVDSGRLKPEEAEKHPRKNEITNALGIPEMKPATILQGAITPEAGDCFLLCTDGLTGMISDKEILKTISKQGSLTAQERADMLIQKAKCVGGLDNITVAIVEFSVAPTMHKPLKKKLYLLYSILVGIVLLLLSLIYVCGNRSQEQIDRLKSEIILPSSDFKCENIILDAQFFQDGMKFYSGGVSRFESNEKFIKDSIDNLQPYFQYHKTDNGFHLFATGLMPESEQTLVLKGTRSLLVFKIPVELGNVLVIEKDSTEEHPEEHFEIQMNDMFASPGTRKIIKSDKDYTNQSSVKDKTNNDSEQRNLLENKQDMDSTQIDSVPEIEEDNVRSILL